MHCEWCRPLLQGHSIIFLYEGCVNGLICLGNFGLKVLKLAKMDFHNSKFLHTNNSSLIWYRIQLLPVHVNGLNHPVGPFLDPLRAHFNDQNRSSFRCHWGQLPHQKSRRSGIVWYYYFKASMYWEKKDYRSRLPFNLFIWMCSEILSNDSLSKWFLSWITVSTRSKKWAISIIGPEVARQILCTHVPMCFWALDHVKILSDTKVNLIHRPKMHGNKGREEYG